MKQFQTIRIVKAGGGFIILKEQLEELWLVPGEDIQFKSYYDLPYQLRDMFIEEENNAAE